VANDPCTVVRKLRFFAPGFPVHVVQRGNNRRAIFRDAADRVRYMDFLLEAADRESCAIHCYVLMGNHVHLLITPAAEESLPKTMQSVGVRYVCHFNKRYERTGGLWDGRYRASLVDSDSYLAVCYRYIEMNPVRAGMVDKPADYRWSSHRHHAFNEIDRAVTAHSFYLDLGETGAARRERYRSLFDQSLTDDELKGIREALVSETL
jgi:putative transposase